MPTGINCLHRGGEWLERLLVAARFFVPWAALWFGSMILSSLWPWRICLALPWESGFPYLPWLVPWYLSLDLMVPLVTLLAPDLDTLRRVYRAMLVQTGVAALVYTVLPQRLGFIGHESGGVWENLAQNTGSANLGWHADAPSLHVAFAFTMARLLIPRLCTNESWWPLAAGWIWAVGVMVSTVFVHEHHLADVASGLVLAWWTCRWAGRLNAQVPKPVNETS